MHRYSNVNEGLNAGSWVVYRWLCLGWVTPEARGKRGSCRVRLGD